tara:strand:+ start:786 stop:1001 length:216 start_codon:yes stop_codon:yes gene_type:complete
MLKWGLQETIMFGLGFGEIVIVLAIVLLFFGGKKLPELGKALGKSMNNFKKGLKETEEGNNDKIDPPKTDA